VAVKRLYFIIGGVAGALVAAYLVGLATNNGLHNTIGNQNATIGSNTFPPASPGQYTLGIVGKALPSAYVPELLQNNSAYTANEVKLDDAHLKSSPILTQVIKGANASYRNSTFSTATVTYPLTTSDLDNMTAAVGGPSHLVQIANVTQDNYDLSGNVIGQVHRESSELNVLYSGTYYVVIVHKIMLLSGRLQ